MQVGIICNVNTIRVVGSRYDLPFIAFKTFESLCLQIREDVALAVEESCGNMRVWTYVYQRRWWVATHYSHISYCTRSLAQALLRS